MTEEERKGKWASPPEEEQREARVESPEEQREDQEEPFEEQREDQGRPAEERRDTQAEIFEEQGEDSRSDKNGRRTAKKRNTIKTGALVEGAILAAVTVLFAIMSSYIPMAEVITIFLMPIPVVLLILRQDIKTGVLSTVVAGILIVMLLGLSGFLILLSFAPTGLAMGITLKKKNKAEPVIAAGVVGYVVSFLAILWVSAAFLGDNIFQTMPQEMRNMMEWVTEFYQKAGVDQANLQRVIGIIEQGIEMMPYIIPSGILFGSVLFVAADYIVIYHVLKRFRIHIPPIPSFYRFKTPPALGFVFLALIFFGLFADRFIQKDTLAYHLYFNLFYGFSMLYILQGLIVILYVLKRLKVNRILCVLIMLIAVMMGNIVLYIGIFDVFWDFRKRIDRLVNRN